MALHKEGKKKMSAKEMFEELGYEYNPCYFEEILAKTAFRSQETARNTVPRAGKSSSRRATSLSAPTR